MPENKLRVLVIDDEKIIRDFFKRLLALFNLDVSEAEDGYKGIELAKQIKFDIFFIDVRMPGINGLETYRQIRQVNPAATVVMMTGYAVEDLLEQAKAEGASRIVRKPFDINEIKDVIAKAGSEKAEGALNILVVDDEESIQVFFANLLKNKNIKHRLVAAKSRKEAIEAARREDFDLIFLDLILEDGNGVVAYKEIKEAKPGANIILITGHPQKISEMGEAVENAIVLRKPFEIDNVLECIEKIKPKINGK